jgi:tRNA-Thr(GGU) m(6)t(6)A37 methyltransferase TsaA
MEPVLGFIGKVHSELKRKQDCPLQENEEAPAARLEIFSEYSAGIKDIKKGSQILLLTWLHKADRTVIECVMRNNFTSPKLGVFSTRSPDRPNPIGIHSATVLSVDDRFIEASALVVLDETPLIDLKPVRN